jgi:hypothetical protein
VCLSVCLYVFIIMYVSVCTLAHFIRLLDLTVVLLYSMIVSVRMPSDMRQAVMGAITEINDEVSASVNTTVIDFDSKFPL